MDAESIEHKLKVCGLVEITDSHFIIDMMYARGENIAGLPVYKQIGLGNRAFAHPQVIEKMLSLIPELEMLNLKLRICDAYRPPLAHILLMQQVPLPGLFAENYQLSNHCHGTAVDVCLTDLNGNNLDFPTEIDAYTPEIAQALHQGNPTPLRENLIRARHDYQDASPTALTNRKLLKELMISHGFEPIPHEWWHYNLQNFEDYPVITI